MTIYTFSDFQLSFLRGVFFKEDAPPPHNTRVHNLGRLDDGRMVIEYEQYGQLKTEIIDRLPTTRTNPIQSKNISR